MNNCCLLFKAKNFLETLLDHQVCRDLFFGQEITDEVIEFVKQNPDLGGGDRRGNINYETKITYSTKVFFHEKDLKIKRYHYCHFCLGEGITAKGNFQDFGDLLSMFSRIS